MRAAVRIEGDGKPGMTYCENYTDNKNNDARYYQLIDGFHGYFDVSVKTAGLSFGRKLRYVFFIVHCFHSLSFRFFIICEQDIYAYQWRRR